MNVNGVTFTIKANDQASDVIRGMQRTLSGMIRSVSDMKDKMHGWMTPLKNVYSWVMSIGTKLLWVAGIAGGVLSAALYKVSSSVLGSTVQMQTLQARLSTVAKEQAGPLWGWANQFATKTPFQLTEIINAMTRLSAYQLEPTSTLPIIGDFASAMGRNMTDTVEMVADAMMGEWERAKEYGLKRTMVEQFAKGKGFNPFNNQGMIIDTAGFQTALFGLMSERGFGGMAKMMDTISGKWSNLQDSITRLFMSMGTIVAPTIQKIIGGITALFDLLNNENNLMAFNEWWNRTFSRENIQKVAAWFINIYVWSKDVFGRIGQFAPDAINWITKAFHNMGKYLKDELVPLIFDVSRILLKIESVKIGLGMTSAMLNLSSMIRNPVIAGVLAGTAIPVGITTGLWANTIGEGALAYGAGQYSKLKKRVTNLDLPQFPGFGEGPMGTEAQGILNTFMSGFDSAMAPLNNAAMQTAANTGTLVNQNASVMSAIFGNGGERMNSLAARARFGNLNSRGGGVNVTINVADQQSADNLRYLIQRMATA